MIEQFISYANDDLEVKLEIIKTIVIYICVYITNFKISNKKVEINLNYFINGLIIGFCSIVCSYLRYKVGYFISIFCWGIIVSLVFDKNNVKLSAIITMISLSINYILVFISIAINLIVNVMIKFQENYINLIIILFFYIIMLNILFRTKRIKYGISSLKNRKQDEYVDILILTISVIILFAFIILSNSDLILGRNLLIGIIIFSIIMFIIIQKSLQLYYKQKMLIKDLTETKEELENKKKEITELEAENIRISKKNHTIVHKQKSIEHKLEEMLTKTEISTEEAGEVKERLEKLHNQIYSEKENTELDKTGISNIDDMLKYMQSECIENKIEFTLVLKGNIHYMVNNLIPKEDLETLIADHIRDAIIAVNHTDNINRSILVKLGDIDGINSLQIYDSGVEFKKEVLENLGKKPFTTYKDEGGTGMGFMNTFDTLRKCEASLIIEEFNKPCPENYTKAIAIRFDGKSNFSVKSYRDIKIDYKS